MTDASAKFLTSGLFAIAAAILIGADLQEDGIRGCGLMLGLGTGLVSLILLLVAQGLVSAEEHESEEPADAPGAREAVPGPARELGE